MANVSVKFNNKDYLLSCDSGQEKNLKELANHLDKKYNELKKNLGIFQNSKRLSLFQKFLKTKKVDSNVSNID